MPELLFHLSTPATFAVDEYLTSTATGASGMVYPILSLPNSQQGETGFSWELSRKLDMYNGVENCIPGAFASLQSLQRELEWLEVHHKKVEK